VAHSPYRGKRNLKENRIQSGISIVVDVTESSVNRLKKGQKEYYSGKNGIRRSGWLFLQETGLKFMQVLTMLDKETVPTEDMINEYIRRKRC
jgi:hypothetical protein